jgi:hypothetical protein
LKLLDRKLLDRKLLGKKLLGKKLLGKPTTQLPVPLLSGPHHCRSGATSSLLRLRPPLY